MIQNWETSHLVSDSICNIVKYIGKSRTTLIIPRSVCYHLELHSEITSYSPPTRTGVGMGHF